MSIHPHFMRAAEEHYQRARRLVDAGDLTEAGRALDEAKVLGEGQLDAVKSELMMQADSDLREMSLELEALVEGIKQLRTDIGHRRNMARKEEAQRPFT